MDETINKVIFEINKESSFISEDINKSDIFNLINTTASNIAIAYTITISLTIKLNCYFYVYTTIIQLLLLLHTKKKYFFYYYYINY